ncbi:MULTISPECIES: Holliday junction resolvase RecU [Mammaliicoccus]|uniref:Holliday junction resolvase RecU n=1 Tax=Mammaliicoccus TaxID=2803850 RepID=UPI0009934E32|nr:MULTISPECIES: Holliday junction resolvase RecU [Mammaliicoccus]MEB6200578.1 Holliday junction resolvase RecU [Mammaliicoccus fleurettii]MEB7724946.1 Holliday junction resolvase RecU [Mammaliicoccus fleurettii]MEB7779332.1 Holliday junction resolvase RecU [Mammaliicoccus fleurettii]MEB7807424.1 Holliday junction resolvase RecU [Mammaliicoccus fleurettii]MEB8067089.1 Holliday junction resolvase RecU [Mammaliicoccus fleurettii]
MNYPNGKKVSKDTSKVLSQDSTKYSKIKYGKRGMNLEEEIDKSNQYFRLENIAVIHKKPTPIQIVDVDYPKRQKAVIKEAYFRKPSTTDYNGVYNGYYIDFEAKETKNKTSFPLNNIHDHQVSHMEQVSNQKGICFLLIKFSYHDSVFLLPFREFMVYWDRYKSGGKKSITLKEIENDGYLIPIQFRPRINYIKIVDQLIKIESEALK